jgi:hypothetical protein
MMAIMRTRPPKIPDAAAWYWIGAIWAGIGLFEATQTVVVMHGEGMHHDWIKLFGFVLMQWLPWALVTPTVMRLGRLYPLVPTGSAMSWLRHLGAWLLVISVASAWGALLEEWLKPYAPDTLPAPLMLLWQPHFLFNVLNGVTGLIRNGESEAAVTMIARLSEFLRHLLHDSGRQEMTLDEELVFLNMYLDLQRVRFSDRLSVSMEIEPGLGRTLVPSLVLQPIVENAIKHGIAQQLKGGLIEVRAARADDTLTVQVFNEGPLLPHDWEGRNTAIGLANVRDRLKSLYGDAAQLVIANARDAGVLVTISMPVREAPA